MKKRLAVLFSVCMLLLIVAPAQASILDDCRDYLARVFDIISDDANNPSDSFSNLHICKYDDISKVWERNDAKFENAFMIDPREIPVEGYIFSFTLNDQFFALVSMDGTIVSIQNMTENAKVSAALANAFKAIDKSKISNEEYEMTYNYIRLLLERDLALSLLNWDSCDLWADKNLNSDVLNVWH